MTLFKSPGIEQIIVKSMHKIAEIIIMPFENTYNEFMDHLSISLG